MRDWKILYQVEEGWQHWQTYSTETAQDAVKVFRSRFGSKYKIVLVKLLRGKLKKQFVLESEREAKSVATQAKAMKWSVRTYPRTVRAEGEVISVWVVMVREPKKEVPAEAKEWSQ